MTKRTKKEGGNDEAVVSQSAEARRLYVGNLPLSMTSSQLVDVFAEAGRQVGGRTVKVNFPEAPRGGERIRPKIRSSYQGFVDSLITSMRGSELVSHFSRSQRSFSRPGYSSAKVIIYDSHSGRSQGFGFISFASAEEVESSPMP